jgi:lysophospholipase L1-like esterase
MTTAETKPRLSWRRRLSLVGFGLLLAVFVVEMIGRALHLMPVPAPAGYYEMRAVVGKMPLPYQYFIHRQEARELSQSEYTTWVHFNYRGLRDIDHDYETPHNSQRILFLGDSFTAGWEVALNETFVSRLRDFLAQLPDRAVNYDLINAGFYGWSPDRLYLFYREEGYRYDSDVVVLQIWVTNDVYEDGYAIFDQGFLEQRPYFRVEEGGQLHYYDYPDAKPAPPSPPSGDFIGQIRFFLDQNSFTYRLVRDGLKTVLQLFRGEIGAPTLAQPETTDFSVLPLPLERFRPEYDAQWQEAWTVTQLVVRELRQTVEAHGGQLVVVIVPGLEEDRPEAWQYWVDNFGVPVDWDPAHPRKLWMDFLDEEGIPYLDLLPGMLDYTATTGDSLRFAVDVHFNAEGHCFVAVELENWLIEQQLIQSPSNYIPQDPVAVCSR